MSQDRGLDSKQFRDPVHGYISIPAAMVPLVQSPFVQRLRNISQNSRAMAAYPSLNGSRYEHALGTMELSMRAWNAAWSNIWGEKAEREAHHVQDDFREDVENSLDECLKSDQFADTLLSGLRKEARQDSEGSQKWRRMFPELLRISVGAVGLLHDIGHPPFSHVLEDAFEEYAEEVLGQQSREQYDQYKEKSGGRAQFHEWVGTQIVKQILADQLICSSLPVTLIWEIYRSRIGQTWSAAIHRMIDDQIDVDRLDYICRDARRAGVDYYAIDIQRLLGSIELHCLGSDGERSWAVGVGQAGISAVESLLIQRDQSYRWMIFHSKAILADTALKRCFASAVGSKVSVNGEPGILKTSVPLPDLDYVSNWNNGRPFAGTSFRVDDHQVTSFLRDVRQSILNKRDNSSRRYVDHMAIWDEFAQIATSTWRNYGEFLEAIENNRALIEQLPSPKAVEDLLLAGLADDLQISVEEMQASEGAIPTPPIAESAKAFLTSDKLGELLADKLSKALDIDPRLDISIEKRLNQLDCNVGGVRGHWLVAHRLKFNAIKVGTDGMRLWSESRPEDFERLSPIYDGLIKSNERRPMFWGFFISRDSEAVVARSDVQKVFLKRTVKFLTD